MISIGNFLDLCEIVYSAKQLIQLEKLVNDAINKYIQKNLNILVSNGNQGKDLVSDLAEEREKKYSPGEHTKIENEDNVYSAENYDTEEKEFEIKKEVDEYSRDTQEANSHKEDVKIEHLKVSIDPNNFFPCIKSGQYQDGLTKETKVGRPKNAPKAPKTKFECKYCDEEYATIWILEGHIKKVHSSFQCHECQYRGPSEELLEKHKIRHSKRKYVCSSCDLSFYNVEQINRHMKLNHGKILEHFCTRCEAVFPTKVQVDKHFNIVHGNNKKFQCEMCDKICANKTNLKYHVNTVHLKLKPYFCEKCGKSFVQKRRLEEHILNIHNPEGKAFQCDLCGNCYASKTSLTIHRRELHNKVFKCDHCAKFFGSKGEISKHVQSVHGSTESNDEDLGNQAKKTQSFHEQYNCAKCHEVFKNLIGLEFHLRKSHNESLAFECSKCLKTFVLKEALDQHIAKEHELKVVKNCQYCKQHFSKLKAHLEVCNSRWPDGKRPTFECPFSCGKILINKDGLRAHKKICKMQLDISQKNKIGLIGCPL